MATVLTIHQAFPETKGNSPKLNLNMATFTIFAVTTICNFVTFCNFVVNCRHKRKLLQQLKHSPTNTTTNLGIRLTSLTTARIVLKKRRTPRNTKLIIFN